PGQERRVGAAAEGDDHAFELPEPVTQEVEGGHHPTILPPPVRSAPMRGGRSPVLLLGLTLVALPGCGGSTKQPVATIGVIAPISSGVTAFGRGIRDAVDLAVREANQRHAVKGWTLRLAVGDARSTPAIGATAARRLAADPTIAGVIGTYNSGVANAVVPELDPASLVMISPGNTDPGLSRSGDSRPH